MSTNNDVISKFQYYFAQVCRAPTMNANKKHKLI